MTEIIFYCIDSDINKFLFNFFKQLIFMNNKKILLYSNSADKLKKLDKILWDFCENTDFLPHSIYDPKNESKKYERLLLSNELLNFNSADYLLISNFLDNFDFIDVFEKVFYVFTNANKNSVNQAKSAFDEYDKMEYKMTLNTKIDGKWVCLDKFKQ